MRFPPEYDYITDIVNQLIAIGGDDVLRMSIPHRYVDPLIKEYKVIFLRSTPKEKLRVLDGVWILYAIKCINSCDAHLDTEIPTFAQFKQSVLPSIKEKYASHQKWGSRFFNRNNPVHLAESIPDVIEALTLRAKLASSEGKEESASMKVLAESFVHGLGF